MGDITRRITKKSLKAKRIAAIKTIKAQAKEKIREVKTEYSINAKEKKSRLIEKEHKKELRTQKANAKLAYSMKQPRPFTLGEDLLNSISHGIGAGLSVAAIVLLSIKAYYHAPADSRSSFIASFAIFGSAMFLVYIISTLYHALISPTARKVFSILNHDAIFILITALYTPFIIKTLEHSSEIVACSVAWGLTGILVALYSVFGARLKTASVITYAVMGWILMGGFAFGGDVINISYKCRNFLIAGGLIYTASGIFFLLKTFKWAHSIFHIGVLAGSILHFFSVYNLI